MKNKDRREEHKKQRKTKLTFHQMKMIDKAIEEIKKYEETKAM